MKSPSVQVFSRAFLDVDLLRSTGWTCWLLPPNAEIPRKQEEFLPFKVFPLPSESDW